MKTAIQRRHTVQKIFNFQWYKNLRKAAVSPHIWDAGTRGCLAFLLDWWQKLVLFFFKFPVYCLFFNCFSTNYIFLATLLLFICHLSFNKRLSALKSVGYYMCAYVNISNVCAFIFLCMCKQYSSPSHQNVPLHNELYTNGTLWTFPHDCVSQEVCLKSL